MTIAAFQVDPRDDVAAALRAIEAGETILGVTARQDIPMGHKIALRDLAEGQPVLKFGFPIGHATRAIVAGEHVHTHNVATSLEGSGAYLYHPAHDPAQPGAAPTFQGYLRADGRVGTRNEIWILPTVGCVARTSTKIAEISGRKAVGRVDGVHAFPHPHGCSQLSEDLEGTRAVLAALASHPNAGGVLIVGLGCESNQIDRLLEGIDPQARGHIRTLTAQMAGDEVEEGVAIVEELIEQAAQTKRTTVPLSKLVLGVKCGGSDGFSGLTANPLVGRMSDAVTGSGGISVLTEIPEIFGAE